MTGEEAKYTMQYSSDALERRMAAEYIIENEEITSEVLELLAKGFLSNDRAYKDYCARVLSGFTKDLAVSAANVVAPYICHEDIEVRNLASDTLMKIGAPSAGALLDFLKHEDPQVRQFACDILGNIENPIAIDDIIILLEDEDMNVKTSAIDALGKLGATYSIERLIDIYDYEEELKPVIIEAIGKIGGKTAQSFLLDKLQTEEDIFLQTNCIDSLALSGEDMSICYDLLGVIDSASEEIQQIILKTVYAIALRNDCELESTPKIKTIARKALMDYDANIRAAGLLALGSVYELDDIEPLAFETSQNNPETQQHILINLLAHSEPEVVSQYLKRCCLNTNPDGSDILYLSYLPLVWDDANEENSKVVIDTLLELIFSTYRGYSTEIVEILMRLDYEKIILKIQDYLLNGSIEQIDDALDLVMNLHINELFSAVHELINKEEPIGSKASLVLKSLRDY